MQQLIYWYRKYIPVVIRKNIKNIIFFIKSLSSGYKYSYFQESIRGVARNARLSYIASLDDDPGTANKDLVNCSVNWIKYANENEITVKETSKPGSQFLNQFPGEHYRLLSALCAIEKPKLIIDIGTYTGMSSRVFLDYAPTSKVITYDLINWKEFDTYLDDEDFSSGRIEQHLVDLTLEDNFSKHKKDFINSDLIFLDAPKNAIFEEKLLSILSNLSFTNKKRFLLVDDIRYHEMFNFWRSINSPKLDMTTFGSWCGTGVVDISKGIDLK